jgi:hypothetical protein
MVRLCAVVTVTLCWSAAGQCEDDACAYAGSALLQSRGQAADQVAAAALQEDVAARSVEGAAAAADACNDLPDEQVAAFAKASGLTVSGCAAAAQGCVSPTLKFALKMMCCATCTQMQERFDAAQAAVPAAIEKAVAEPKCLGITAAIISYRFGIFGTAGMEWPFYPLYTHIMTGAGWKYKLGYNYQLGGDYDHMGLWAKDGNCLVTFQGSDHESDYASLYNAQPVQFKGLFLHAGMAAEFQGLYEQVNFSDPEWQVCEDITAVGHSLGGALAQIFAAVTPTVNQIYVYGSPSPFAHPAPITCAGGTSFANGYPDPDDGSMKLDTVKIMPAPFSQLNVQMEVWLPTDRLALQPGRLADTVSCPDAEGSSMDLAAYGNGQTSLPTDPYYILHSGGTYAGILDCWETPLVQLYRS